MRQLSDILIEKSKEVGGKAALGRLLGGLTGQAIGQYINGGGMPSFATALKWKEVFGENLIDLMSPPVQSTDSEDIRTMKAMEKTIDVQDALIAELKTQLNECRKVNGGVKKLS